MVQANDPHRAFEQAVQGIKDAISLKANREILEIDARTLVTAYDASVREPASPQFDDERAVMMQDMEQTLSEHGIDLKDIAESMLLETA